LNARRYSTSPFVAHHDKPQHILYRGHAPLKVTRTTM